MSSVGAGHQGKSSTWPDPDGLPSTRWPQSSGPGARLPPGRRRHPCWPRNRRCSVEARRAGPATRRRSPAGSATGTAWWTVRRRRVVGGRDCRARPIGRRWGVATREFAPTALTSEPTRPAGAPTMGGNERPRRRRVRPSTLEAVRRSCRLCRRFLSGGSRRGLRVPRAQRGRQDDDGSHLGTLIAPSSGSVTVAGLPLLPENGVDIRRRISIMPESPGLYLRLSVRENLQCFADLCEITEPQQRIDQALQAVKLTERVDDACGTRQQRGLRQRRGAGPGPAQRPAGAVPGRSFHVGPPRIPGRRPATCSRAGSTDCATVWRHHLPDDPSPGRAAERLCDRVAILNTTLRTIGRPDELRDQLFAKPLAVTTASPLPDPARVFAGIPALDGWRADGPTFYVLAVSRHRPGRPGRDPGSGGGRRRRPGSIAEVAPLPGGRLPGAQASTTTGAASRG